VAASDGSAHAGIKASFAYCLANSRSGKIIYASHGPTLVDPEYASSDRSELLGILGVVTKLHEIEDGIKDRINKKKKKPSVTLYTDSSSSISVLKNKFRPSTKNVMKSNLDVILEIQEERKKLKSSLHLVHVKAHQDNEIRYEDLPLPARLNVDMDKLAEKQYEKPIQEHYVKMTHLPAQAISFSTPWYRLTNDMEQELISHRRDTPGEAEALSSWEVDPTDSKNIDWIAIEGAMKTWTKYQRGTPVKCVHELWDTTKRKKDWGQIKCGKCPLCGQEDEDAPHVLRCKHPLMKAAREHELSKLSSIVNSSKISEILQRWIMVMSKQWIQSFPPSIPPKNETFREIRNAINSQKKLSIRNMFRGILSVRWRKMHEVNLQKEYGENVSGQSLATKISKAFIDFSIAMWKIRCQIIHANNIGSEEDFFRKRSLEVCENLKKDPLSLSKHDKQLCKRTKIFFK